MTVQLFNPKKRSIPAIQAMEQLGDRFLTSQLEKRAGKATKWPYVPGIPERADSTDPTTWTSLDEAFDDANGHRLRGVSVVLGELSVGRWLVDVDLDNTRDTETGEPRDWAQGVVDAMATYTGVSPSGTGYKLYGVVQDEPRLMRNKKVITNGKEKAQQIELFATGRYFWLTGNHLPGTPKELNDITEAFGQVAASLDEGERPKANGAAPGYRRWRAWQAC